MQYTENFSEAKIENFIGKILIFFDCGYTEAALTSTHNLCFGSEIRKIGIPLQTAFSLCKSGVEGGIYCTDMLS